MSERSTRLLEWLLSGPIRSAQRLRSSVVAALSVLILLSAVWFGNRWAPNSLPRSDPKPSRPKKRGQTASGDVRSRLPTRTEGLALLVSMFEIGTHFERLKQAQAAGWKAPPGRPDIDPPRDAATLLKSFRDVSQLPAVKAQPQEFRRWLAEAKARASDLEIILWQGKFGALESSAAERAFLACDSACVRCHDKYRDESSP